MRHWSSELIAGALALAVAGCGDAMGVEGRELRALDRAIASTAAASSEERIERIDELERVPVTSERAMELKKLCLQSYRAFNRAQEQLARSRERMSSAERAVADARAREQAGAELDDQQRAELLRTSKQATDALVELGDLLDVAEALVGQCDERRQAMRALLDS